MPSLVETWLGFLRSDGTGRNVVATLVLGLAVVVARQLAANAVRRSSLGPPEVKRAWLVRVRNVSILVFLALAVPIWARELRTLALSLVAVAAALAISVKELLLCVLGGLLRSSSGSFGIGDRIEINGVRGDVIDHTLFTTTIMEIGPGTLFHQVTGRAVTIPNAWYLSHPVVNESFTDQFVFHTFYVSLPRESDFPQEKRRLLGIASDVTRDYLDEARQHFQAVNRRLDLEVPKVEPRISVELSDAKQMRIAVRVPVPARRKGRIEQRIVAAFLGAEPEED